MLDFEKYKEKAKEGNSLKDALSLIEDPDRKFLEGISYEESFCTVEKMEQIEHLLVKAAEAQGYKIISLSRGVSTSNMHKRSFSFHALRSHLCSKKKGINGLAEDYYTFLKLGLQERLNFGKDGGYSYFFFSKEEFNKKRIMQILDKIKALQLKREEFFLRSLDVSKVDLFCRGKGSAFRSPPTFTTKLLRGGKIKRINFPHQGWEVNIGFSAFPSRDEYYEALEIIKASKLK